MSPRDKDVVISMLFCFVFAALIFGGMYWAHTVDTKINEKRHEYQKACVDAGGSPVITFSYVKGSNDGYLCINPSAIIELK